MRLIKPSFEIIEQKPGMDGLLQHIERCGRTCYKSEDKITGDSAEKFVNMLVNRGHTAMVEHGTVYLKFTAEMSLPSMAISDERVAFYDNNKYSEVVIESSGLPNIWLQAIGMVGEEGTGKHISITKDVYVTTNYRVLLQNDRLDDLQYLCEPTEHHAKRITVKFVCDRGVSHEFVRHRVFSFAQESTRYCNYSKDKFGKELNCIIPCWYKNMFEGNSYNIELCHTYDLTISEGLSRTEAAWIQAMCEAESTYFGLLTEGEPAQQARNVLPLALKTELIMTGTVEQWIEFLKLRCANDAHPQARELAIELRDRLLLDNYIDIDAEGNLQVSNRY